jgi:hypothetical protein
MMRAVTTPLLPTSLALRRGGVCAVGWVGLCAFLWATLGLPAVHTLEHAREDQAEGTAHTDDVHVLLREALARARGHHTPHDRGHHHRHDGGAPGTPEPAHGHGSAQHFSLAVLAASPPRLPPRAVEFETLSPRLQAGLPASSDVLSSRTSRGPPPARAI